MKISYAITVCNEYEEIVKLLDFLLKYKRDNDQIVVLYDSNNGTKNVLDYVNSLKDKGNCSVYSAKFNNHFAYWKNLLTSYCTGDYIFQIDADEIPAEHLIDNVHDILSSNAVDLIYLPRVNTVEGLTKSHIDKWRWNVDDKGRVNWPDYQTRIYKNTDDILWMNKVHERITGYDTFSNFPADENYCLYHHKQIKKQEKQNEFYETI